MLFIIYGLVDPRDKEAVRYVGFSANPNKRLKAHISEAKKSQSNTHKINWIRKLLAEGVSPIWRELDSVETLRGAAQREMELIRQFSDAQANLTNGTTGGDGSVLWTPLMHDARSRISQKYWADPKAREQQRAAMQSWHATEDGAAKQARVDKIRTAVTGVKYSAESREKMRIAKLGKPQMPRTPEWAAKISAAQKGIKRGPWSEERKTAHRVRLSDPETKARMSASAKARGSNR